MTQSPTQPAAATGRAKLPLSRIERRIRLGGNLALPMAVSAMLLASTAHAQQSKDLEITNLRIGFNDIYKLGCWTPAEITLQGGDKPYTGLVAVSVPDTDGVPTIVYTDRPVGIVPGQPATARLFVRSGQDGADVKASFIDLDSQKEIAKRQFHPGPDAGQGHIRAGLPATNRIVISFGSKQGVGDLARSDQQNANEQNATHAVRLENAAHLPLQWYGYDSVDILVLGSSQPELYRPLVQNTQRVEAIRRWVELGGRVVIFCGSAAPELIAPGGPLEKLVPGRFDTLAPLRQSAPLETFSGSEQTIANGQINLSVPRLTDVRGQILAYWQNPADLPLVIRSRLGLGEITFVAVDPDAPPLATWPGRPNLIRQALQWPEPPTTTDNSNQSYGNYGNEELINRLRNALDQQFVGVKTAPFALVAALVVIYILLIGPGDYFLLKRLKRMEWTWLTFPAIVVAVSATAYWLAYWMKGDQLRVNQVEIVDVDLESGLARGTVWTHFFSPRAEKYDLTIQPHFAEKPLENSDDGGPAAQNIEKLVAWLGSPGYGLGGMEGQHGGGGTLFDRGYQFSPPLDALQGLPVQEWSTKTLLGRWSATIEAPVEADLQLVEDGLITGHVTNRTGRDLEDCILMHGNWAYPLPPLADGAGASIDRSVEQKSVKTMLTSLSPPDGAGPDPVASRLEEYTTDVHRIVTAMMFFEAAGGEGYANAPSRYQSFIDMSSLIKGNQAVLVARVPSAVGSRWLHGAQPLTSPQDQRWVYYRFVIPLRESVQGAEGRGQ